MNPYTYRLLTDSPAKKKAKKLVEIVGLMGFDIKLSRAQELVARLMGYVDWAELIHVTREAPERGVPDQMLPPRAAAGRQKHQRELLIREFGIDRLGANSILTALAPTGEVDALHRPSITNLNLRLTDEDQVWLDESMKLIREFDAAVRPLFALSTAQAGSPDAQGLIRVRVERTVPGKQARRQRETRPADIVDWVARGFPGSRLTGKTLAEVTDRAEAACRIFAALDTRLRSLGVAPMLAPIDWTFLELCRSSVVSERPYYTAVASEPWLHIGFDLPGFVFNPENEWNASRGLSLQLALRREFFDAGWTGEGPEWRVTFRDGNSAKEELVVRAPSSSAAYAWVAAARAALRLAKHQTVSVISLISVIGPDGIFDPAQVLLAAMNEAVIRRGKLLTPDRLRVRGRKNGWAQSMSKAMAVPA